MKLSIITPCSRPHNLPIIYNSILSLNTDNVEWLVIFDSDEIDNRIMMYQENIPIRLFNIRRGYGKGGTQRNYGLDYCSGDWIYYLDDDNLIHSELYNKILSYGKNENILLFNQFSPQNKKRIKVFNTDIITIPGCIDTAQMVIPKKYKNFRWFDEPETIVYEETKYLNNIIKIVGIDNIRWVDRVYTFRNYLRRFELDSL